jgi:hypothetical protein
MIRPKHHPGTRKDQELTRHPRHIRLAIAFTVALLVASTTAAVAQNDTTKQPQLLSQKAIEAQAHQVVTDRLERVKKGLPAQADEASCDAVRKPENLKALKAQGIKQTSCVTEKKLSDADRKAVLDKVGVSDVPMADFPAPTGTGTFQANGLHPISNEEVNSLSLSCGLITDQGTFTLSRTQGCVFHAFVHSAIRISDGANLGDALVVDLLWQDLDVRSRAWDMHYLTVIVAATGITQLGLNMYMWGDCTKPCERVASTPWDGWQLVPVGQIWSGKVRLMSIENTIDYSYQAAGLWTMSNVAGAQNAALSVIGPFMEVRCDAALELVTFAGTGCVYWKFAGGLRLSASDPVIGEAARFYRDMQATLVTHPGARGFNPLSRAWEWERAANRSISKPICDKLPKASGESCDEYPFAATEQGAAFGPKGVTWDVKAVNAKANSMVGTLLSVMYGAQRIYPGDKFYVDIVP